MTPHPKPKASETRHRAVQLGLLTLLGFLWAMRVAAIKAAGLSGIPVHVVLSAAILGLAVVFTLRAVLTADWPPINGTAMRFYGLTGVLGFLAPFALESAAAPHLPVFLFIVIISTMPIMTLLLSILTGGERATSRALLSVGIGFACALLIISDTPHDPDGTARLWWVLAAFAVPLFYSLNTVFVARRWPDGVTSIQVAQAQTIIVGAAALLGLTLSGAISDIAIVGLNPVALLIVVGGEALAMLVYFRITRAFGATWVSLANYIAMVFAAILGTVLFGDHLGGLTIVAAVGIVLSVSIYRKK